VVISAGQDGVLDTPPAPGDLAEVTGGYETSLTCDALSTNAGDICSASSECTGLSGSCTGPEVLVRINGFRNGDLDREWVVLSNRQVPAAADFGKITLMPGTDIFLAFVQDLDNDGLFAREEYLRGSTDSRTDNLDNSAFGVLFDETDPATQGSGPDGIPDSRDTDRDGLSDFAEARIGWRVGVDDGSLRSVYSSPRLRDSDGDGLLDPEEQDLRTYCATQPAVTQSSGWCAFLADPPVLQVDAVGIIAGLNGIADSIAQGDDIQVIPAGTTGLTFAGIVIGPGPDGLVSTAVAADDEFASNASLSRIPPATDPGLSDTDFDGLDDIVELTGANVGLSIRDGGDGLSDTRAIGDDVQQVPIYVPLPPFGVVVLPGPNGVIDSSVARIGNGNDYLFFNGLSIQCGADGVISTKLSGDDSYRAGVFNDSCTFTSTIIDAGLNGIIDSVPNNISDDRLQASFLVQTDPLRGDTDSDLIADGREVEQGGDPTDPGDGPDFRDSDLDGLSDAAEDFGWIVPGFGRVISNKNLADSDLDGLPDLIERDIASHPGNPDTDGDSLPDFDEFTDFARYFGLEQQFRGFSVNGSASARYGTDPSEADTDADGRRDDEELLTGYRILIAGEPSFRQIFTNPLVADTDLDGLTDDEEWGKTDATDPDTDDDGRTDFQEVNAIPPTDPLVPDLQITVRFQQLQLNGAGIGSYDLQWDFNVATNGEFPGTQVSNEQYAYYFPWSECAAFPGSGLGRIRNLGGGTFFTGSGVLGERTFKLGPGEGFILNGNVNDVNSCDTGTVVNYDCKSKFFKAYTFENLAQNGFTTETLTLTQTLGTCGAAEIVYTIEIN
jgi:hypothetical protein